MELPVPKLAARMAERLNFSLARYRATKTPDEAFTHLRETIEASGVYVLLLGNLGSHHTNIPVEVFRGFALADNIAPLIVINDQDAGRHGRSPHCTNSRTSGWDKPVSAGRTAENQIERYCNDVAGEFLLPASELRQLAPVLKLSVATIAEQIGPFAQAHRVSRAMVAYKLYRTGMIGKTTWAALDQRFKDEYLQFKQREAENYKKAEGGPNYYIVRRHRMGHALLGLVRRSLDEGTITYTKASRVLGVKPRSVEATPLDARCALREVLHLFDANVLITASNCITHSIRYLSSGSGSITKQRTAASNSPWKSLDEVLAGSKKGRPAPGLDDRPQGCPTLEGNGVRRNRQ
jgi:Zn-dependent peptidase ImmA (M78 family)